MTFFVLPPSPLLMISLLEQNQPHATYHALGTIHARAYHALSVC